MNWKVIGKYTGFIYLTAFIIGFGSEAIEQLFLQRGDAFIPAAITYVLVIIVIFTNLAIEQRKRTFSHAAVVTLLSFLISLPINILLFQQPLFEAAISFAAISVIPIIGVGIGTALRWRAAKLDLPVRDEVKFSAGNVRIPADKIVFCLYCRTNNRLRKGTMFGIKPVCGKCGSFLEINESPSKKLDNKFVREYVDVDADSTIFSRNPVATDNLISDFGNQAEINDIKPEFYVEEDLPDKVLMEKVYKLFYYNCEEVHRIVASKKKRFPEKSDRWHWEKTYDDEKQIRQ